MVSVIYFPSPCLCIFTWRQYSVLLLSLQGSLPPKWKLLIQCCSIKHLCKSPFSLVVSHSTVNVRQKWPQRRTGSYWWKTRTDFSLSHLSLPNGWKPSKETSPKRFRSLSFDLREVLYVTSDFNGAWRLKKRKEKKKDQNIFEEYKFSAPCCLPVLWKSSLVLTPGNNLPTGAFMQNRWNCCVIHHI